MKAQTLFSLTTSRKNVLYKLGPITRRQNIDTSSPFSGYQSFWCLSEHHVGIHIDRCIIMVIIRMEVKLRKLETFQADVLRSVYSILAYYRLSLLVSG